MTGAALGAGAAGSGIRSSVAIETAAHPRQLIPRGKLEVFDCAVALRAADVARDVQRVIEAQVRFRERERGHAITGRAAVTEVTIGALRQWLCRISADLRQIPMVAAVTSVAAAGLWQQRVGASAANFGIFVTGRAGQLQVFDVAPMVEADREILVRKDRGARAVVSGRCS